MKQTGCFHGAYENTMHVLFADFRANGRVSV
jgi:hypothetical protein